MLGELVVEVLLDFEVIAELYLDGLAIVFVAGQFARPTVHFLSIEYNNSHRERQFSNEALQQI